MFAFLNIKTTGSKKIKGRILDIAVIVYEDGREVKRFSSLVNPETNIPWYVYKYAEITNDMIWDAPVLRTIAEKIIAETEGCTVVTHHAFMYRVLQQQLHETGFDFNRPAIFTARHCAALFPFLEKYDLGTVCECLTIPVENLNRALPSAEATALLFQQLVDMDPLILIQSNSNEDSKKLPLPHLLNESSFLEIPEGVTGVYYFHNSEHEVIYVGKSTNVKKRISQHFNAKSNSKTFEMLQQIADISYESTGNELTALLLESEEIKKLKPVFNISQKRTRLVSYYGIFQKRDRQRYINLFFKKIRNDEEPILTVENIVLAKQTIKAVAEKFNLCLAKCSLEEKNKECYSFHLNECRGACVKKELPHAYNERVLHAITELGFNRESFFILGDGRNAMEKSVVCVEQGKYKGFGFIDFTFGSPTSEEMRDSIKPHSHNRNIQRILATYMKSGFVKIPFEPQQTISTFAIEN